ncbi:FkbM family methyltransferase [Methylopila henanensis]|uniref:FkbM family methyltransferase n=1 Tax=Methylopila henanensis TaxID=873516 RepID=A0ABW4K399_9HYPH
MTRASIFKAALSRDWFRRASGDSPAVPAPPSRAKQPMPQQSRKLLITDNKTFSQFGVSPVRLCDVGARDDIVEPWKRIEAKAPDVIRVVGFEPDPRECARLNARQGERRQYYATALWSSVGEIEFNITRSPAQSSGFEPDIETLTRLFPVERWRGRQVRRKVTVQADTLDRVCARDGLSIDFIKLDTQGAEYEILAGATETLKTCFGAQAECWHYPAYRGLRLAQDVMRLMADNGFSVFAYSEGGSWRRGADEVARNDRSQPVQADILFLKNVETLDLGGTPFERAVKWAAIAELWGFASYAKDILKRWAETNPDASENFQGVITRIEKNAVANFEVFGRSGGFPSLR